MPKRNEPVSLLARRAVRPVLGFFLLLSIPFCSAQAQASGDWDAFVQKINVTDYQKGAFRLRAAVKVQLTGDHTGCGALWARVDKKNGRQGFFYNMMDHPIRDSEWKEYTITGPIDKKARWLNIGGLFFRNGRFLFDHFQLELKKKNGSWETVPLVNAGFEQTGDSIVGWRFFHKPPAFSRTIARQQPYRGRHYLQITGSALPPLHRYGQNASAGHYAPVNGIRLYYETYGKGAPLLLLHGNRGSIANFSHQIPVFSQYFKVIAVDSRGQGKSTEDGRPYSYDLFAEDMKAFLDYLDLDSVRIVGWSDGGNTGLIMAMRYPAKVKKLVTMGANVFIDHSVVSPKVFHLVKKQLRALRKDTAYRARNQSRLARLLLQYPQHRFTELERITCPVLVMAGEHDLIKTGHTKSIAAHLANSTLLIVPGATHQLPEANPKVFNRYVLDFLRAKEKAAPPTEP